MPLASSDWPWLPWLDGPCRLQPAMAGLQFGSLPRFAPAGTTGTHWPILNSTGYASWLFWIVPADKLRQDYPANFDCRFRRSQHGLACCGNILTRLASLQLPWPCLALGWLGSGLAWPGLVWFGLDCLGTFSSAKPLWTRWINRACDAGSTSRIDFLARLGMVGLIWLGPFEFWTHWINCACDTLAVPLVGMCRWILEFTFVLWNSFWRRRTREVGRRQGLGLA